MMKGRLKFVTMNYQNSQHNTPVFKYFIRILISSRWKFVEVKNLFGVHTV